MGDVVGEIRMVCLDAYDKIQGRQILRTFISFVVFCGDFVEILWKFFSTLIWHRRILFIAFFDDTPSTWLLPSVTLLNQRCQSTKVTHKTVNVKAR